MKREYLDRFSGNSIRSRENPSSGSQVFLCGRTDGLDEAKSRSLQICELALQRKQLQCYLLYNFEL
jgi:hypothetical protein